MPAIKLFCRAARRLHDVWLAQFTSAARQVEHPLDCLRERQRALHQARQRLDKARLHGLALILPGLRAALRARARDVQESAEQVWQHVEQPVPAVPSLPALVEELSQLDVEFHGLRIDWGRRVLAVTTEPITLQGVDLGPFVIEFFWQRFGRHTDVQCFDVVAKDPRPAPTNHLVTHPHVRDQKLCAGDAAAPVQKALAQGRLADAFLLIRGVLTHYNSGSPHVALDEWDGVACGDCGRSVSEDEVSSCGACGRDLCSECERACSACSDVYCPECARRCEVCEDSYCAGCLTASAHSDRDCCAGCLRPCPACGAQVAEDELGEDGAPCPACQERQRNAAQPNPPSTLDPETEEVHEAPADLVPAVC